jgi:hypothetical protein
MIHLVSGESTCGTLRETSVPGDKISIDDILMEGPIVDGLQSESSWNQRAEYLERYFTIPKSDYLSGKAKCDGILENSLSHDEIILWFEFDLFCQANLLYLLNWFASRDLKQTRLTLVCPTVFLGELPADKLEPLFPTRVEITTNAKQIAQRAWQALSSDDPRAIEQFLLSDTSSLPCLAPALRGHLERFPSTTNGLGIIGQRTLEVLSEGPTVFHKLFPRVNSTPEIRRYGMGDLTLQSYLDIWASGASPLVQENGIVDITAAGRDVIQNHADAIDLNGIDLWYGGVHLTPNNLWRWNAATQKLER